jgi:hypothetical protein
LSFCCQHIILLVRTHQVEHRKLGTQEQDKLQLIYLFNCNKFFVLLIRLVPNGCISNAVYLRISVTFLDHGPQSNIDSATRYAEALSYCLAFQCPLSMKYPLVMQAFHSVFVDYMFCHFDCCFEAFHCCVTLDTCICIYTVVTKWQTISWNVPCSNL